jgi:hypothetical protein
VHQQLTNDSNSSSSSSGTFLLTVTAQLLVPEDGDCGMLSAALPALGLKQQQQVCMVETNSVHIRQRGHQKC